MTHADTAVDLPERGLVIVTGKNGSGKSSLIEAVAAACWGSSLRGTPVWPKDGSAAMVYAEIDNLRVRRMRKGERAQLGWDTGPESKPPDYENNTKAQEALESVIGTMSTWRRTHVFSSHDAAHFTEASDGERKRLLETVLGLERFDAALERCRRDLKEAEQANRQYAEQAAELVGKVQECQKRVCDAEAALVALPKEVKDLVQLEADRVQCAKMFAAASDELNALVDEQRRLALAGKDRESEAREIERRLASLAISNCDRCEQPIPQALRDRLTAAAKQAREGASVDRQYAAPLEAAIRAQIAELSEERDVLLQKGSALRAQIDGTRIQARQREQALSRLAAAQADLKRLQDAAANMAGVAESKARQAAMLSAVEQVLGLKGVRAHVLGKTLAGVERVANSWLARIAGAGMRLTLKPYSEKKTGGVTDAISLEVEGAGGGYGYKASSGGQRRRIDVALLLALAEVSQAALNRAPGTIFADECFDALDEEGVDRVGEVLMELAQERCLVVISHNSALVGALKPVMKLHVDAGKVVRCA